MTPSVHPTLVLNSYEVTGTNTNAKLELRNTTWRPVWLYYSGSEFPLQPPFLERPTVVPLKAANGFGTNIYSLRVGHFFMHGEKVLPGDSIRLEFPLRSGESPKHVGVSYYVGNFSDGNDFVNHFLRPYLDSKANLKDKARFYWRRFRERFKSPERREIWCEDLLSFPEAATNSPPK
jgi:hypothetical protein